MAEESVRVIVARVQATNRRFQMIKPDTSVVIGSSGGADSTCLLHMLASGSLGFDVACTAVYVDHGLRTGTEAEQEFVESLARSVGASFVAVSVDVHAALDAGGGSVQDVARGLRYDALRSEARRVGAAKVAVGHTRDDQAETVLLQLLRGAGTSGLAGIAPVREGIVRPLLELTRSQTEEYCRIQGLQWHDDPSNAHDTYARNRVRHRLIPYLKEYNPRIAEGLVRTAEITRAEDEYLETAAQEAYELLVSTSDRSAETWTLDAVRLKELPLALARRVVRRLVRDVRGSNAQPSFDQVEAILALADSTDGSAEFRGMENLVVIREYGRLSFTKAKSSEGGDLGPESVDVTPIELVVPGQTSIPWAGMQIEASFSNFKGTPVGGPNAVTIDFDRVALPLRVRARLSGDWMRPLGLGGRKKVKDVLIDRKVPRAERKKAVIVCDEKGVIWLAGHVLDERVKVTDATRRLLTMRAVQ